MDERQKFIQIDIKIDGQIVNIYIDKQKDRKNNINIDIQKWI